MPTQECTCGAKYRFAENALGRRAKCQQCGRIFTLRAGDETGPIPLAVDDDVPERGVAAARVQVEAAPPKQGELFVPKRSPDAQAAAGDPSEVIPESGPWAPSFGSDALWAFLFPAAPANIVKFLVICGAWVLLSGVPLIMPFYLGLSRVGLILGVVIAGFYAAFRLEIVRSAAAGEGELPDFPSHSDLIYDFIEPLFHWVGSWVVVLIPATIYLFASEDPFRNVRWSLTAGVAWEALAPLTGGLKVVLGGLPTEMVVFKLLVYAGLCLWPIVVLCVAMGGFSTLYRLDLIAVTIGRTLPGYLLTIGLMSGVIMVQTGLFVTADLVLAWRAKQPADFTYATRLVVTIVGRGIDVYLEIVAMRLIGLYYYHFKNRFAWSWE